MAAPPEHIDFRIDDRAAVIARMDGLARTGQGWINLSPALDEDEPPPRSSNFGLFSGRGPDVPLCTWVPGTPTQVGVQHGAGPKVADVLRTLGEPVPEGWRVTQDHSRRGLEARQLLVEGGVVLVLAVAPLPGVGDGEGRAA